MEIIKKKEYELQEICLSSKWILSTTMDNITRTKAVLFKIAFSEKKKKKISFEWEIAIQKGIRVGHESKQFKLTFKIPSNEIFYVYIYQNRIIVTWYLMTALGNAATNSRLND